MDTNIRVEFDRLWGNFSELDKKLALNIFKTDLNNKELNELQEDLEEHLNRKFKTVQAEKDRKNNIKVALIGFLAGIIPFLLYYHTQ